MERKYDVIVVGGGAIGGSIAFQLAKRGMSVAIFEKGRIACEASSAAGGMLGAQVELEKETGPLFELAVKSRSMFPQMAEEIREITGIDIGFVNRGMLRLAATYEQVLELQEIIECQRLAGAKAEWLTAEEVKEIEPNLSADVLGAMYIPDDGQVLAPELSLGYAKAAACYGADIYEFTEVKSFLTDNSRVCGVVTENETFQADHVVIASGSWSSHLLKSLGIFIPIYPVKGECFSVTTDKPLIQSTVFTHGCYLVPKKGGRLLVGATMKENTFDKKVSVQGIATLMESAKRLLPAIGEAEFEKCWAGLRPQTIDGLPFLGEHPDWKGLYLAAGHFRNGILLSPITGAMMAELIQGKPNMDISAFSMSRIKEWGNPIREASY